MIASEPPFVLIPQRMAAKFHQWASSWGWLDMKWDRSENVVAIAGFSDKQATRLGYTDLFERGHYLRGSDTVQTAGLWYRVKPELHDYYLHARMRGLPIGVEHLKAAVSQGWRQPPADRPWLNLTFTQEGVESRWSAWWVNSESVFPASFDVVRDDLDPLAYLAGAWPVEDLALVAATVIGVGSIGSTVAEALGAAGIGHLTLADPDRLRHHNLPRHRLTEQQLGRYKATAMRDFLGARFPHLEPRALVADVARDADLMRPVCAESDVVVCATDGVESRRVANHLARRARVPIILAAVLEDGAFGEIIRVRPRTGCLWCLRRTLTENGTLDPEPHLDQDYGMGNVHRPMTAAPTDLRVIGEIAAKAAVATVLERRGHWKQRLPGDWAILGLQPAPEMPPPFDLDQAGAVRWHDLPPTRSDCPTCTAP